MARRGASASILLEMEPNKLSSRHLHSSQSTYNAALFHQVVDRFDSLARLPMLYFLKVSGDRKSDV
jgi:hypothetical protein